MSKNNFRKIACCANCKHLGEKNISEVNGYFYQYYKPACELDKNIVFYDTGNLKMYVCDKFEESEEEL